MASGVTGTSTTLTATNSYTYYVAVQSVGSGGDVGGWRDSAAAAPYTPPSTSPPPSATPAPTAAPTPAPAPPGRVSSVSVTRSDETLHVSWPAVDGATHYHITYALTSAGNRSWVAASTNHTTNSIDIKHVLNTPSYIVGVRAGNSGGWGGWRNSAPTGGYLPPNPKPLPDPPASVTLTRGDGTLTVAWPAASNATSYSVFWMNNSDSKHQENWTDAVLYTTATSVTLDANNYLDYTTAVRSHNGTGDSAWAESATSAATQTLLPPSYVAVTRGDGTLSASWAAADGATSYHIGWTDNNGASWHRERTSYVGTTIDFTVPVVDNNKTYGVNVMSTIGDVQSVWRYSNYAPPYVNGTPGRPASVTVTRGDGTLTASWDAVANATSYHITYSSNNKQSWSLGAFAHSGTSITISGVDNAKTYVVGVRGLNSANEGGAWRNSAPAGAYTPPVLPNPPAAPTNVAVAPGDGFLGVTWSAVDGADSYEVRAKPEGGGTSWIDVATGVTGTSYDYVTTQTIDHVGVRARNTGGASDWSDVSRLPSESMLATMTGSGGGSGNSGSTAALGGFGGGFGGAVGGGLGGAIAAAGAAPQNQVSGQSQLAAPVWGTIDRDVNRFNADIDLNWTSSSWATGYNLVCSDTDGWTWNVCGWEDDDERPTYTSVPSSETLPVTVTHYRRGSDSPHTPGDYRLRSSRHYTIAIRAVNSNPADASDWVRTQIIRPIFPMLRDYTSTRTDGQVTLSWTPNPWTTGYNVYCDNYTSGGTYSPSYTLCASLTNQDDTADLHSVTITSWSAGGTNYSIDNTSTLDIAIDSTNATGSARWLTPLISASKTLSTSSVSATGATLTIHGHSGNWWYKGRVRNGTYGDCTQVTGSTSVTLSTLTASTGYEYHAYSATGCADANLIATAEFRTIASGSGPALALTNVTQTTARVTLSGHTGNWWYINTPRAGDTGPCTAGPSGFVVNLAPLDWGSTYTFAAYSDSTCSTELVNVTFATSDGPELTASSVRNTTATLNLANYDGDWWYQGTARGGAATSCIKASGTTVNLTNLTAGAVYTYGAFSANTCTTAVELDNVTFTMLNATLAVSNIGATTARLTVGGHTAQWWYKAERGPAHHLPGPGGGQHGHEGPDRPLRQHRVHLQGVQRDGLRERRTSLRRRRASPRASPHPTKSETNHTTALNFGPGSFGYGQQFTTGSAAGGYKLLGVTLDFDARVTNASAVTVSIREKQSNGLPRRDGPKATLTGTLTSGQGGQETFDLLWRGL